MCYLIFFITIRNVNFFIGHSPLAATPGNKNSQRCNMTALFIRGDWQGKSQNTASIERIPFE
jgi:hypothetical protein